MVPCGCYDHLHVDHLVHRVDLLGHRVRLRVELMVLRQSQQLQHVLRGPWPDVPFWLIAKTFQFKFAKFFKIPFPRNRFFKFKLYP